MNNFFKNILIVASLVIAIFLMFILPYSIVYIRDKEIKKSQINGLSKPLGKILKVISMPPKYFLIFRSNSSKIICEKGTVVLSGYQDIKLGQEIILIKLNHRCSIFKDIVIIKSTGKRYSLEEIL